jgi:hypothetical protein
MRLVYPNSHLTFSVNLFDVFGNETGSSNRDSLSRNAAIPRTPAIYNQAFGDALVPRQNQLSATQRLFKIVDTVFKSMMRSERHFGHRSGIIVACLSGIRHALDRIQGSLT